ncbi:MAG: arylsulfatase, partial [Planctomycetota bacterium]
AQKRPNRAWCIDGETLEPYTPKERDFYTTDAFTERALAYLDEYADEAAPFFLYVAYTAPHDPLMAPAEDIARYAGRYDAGWQATRAARWARQRELGLYSAGTTLSDAEFGDWDALSAAERREEARRMEVYAAMVDRLDRNVGALLAKLEELGELEDTLVLFASDNGGSADVVDIGEGEIGTMTRWTSVKRNWANVSNTPFRKFKNHSYEGGICTPLIVHWPRGIAAVGGFVREPVHFVDIMATLVDLAGAQYPTEHSGALVVPMRGASLLPLLAGEPLRRAAPLFWAWSQGKAVREGAWKLVSHGGPWELYDISADRTEMRNLAAEQPERVERMAAAWTRWRDRQR